MAEKIKTAAALLSEYEALAAQCAQMSHGTAKLRAKLMEKLEQDVKKHVGDLGATIDKKRAAYTAWETAFRLEKEAQAAAKSN